MNQSDVTAVGAEAASADHTDSHPAVRSLRRHEMLRVGFEKAPQKIWIRGGCPQPRPITGRFYNSDQRAPLKKSKSQPASAWSTWSM